MPVRAISTFGTVRANLRAGAFSFSDVQHEPLRYLPPHVHAELHICYVSRGAFVEGSGRSAEACGPGTLIVKAPGTEHWNQIGVYGARSLAICVEPGAGGMFNLARTGGAVSGDRTRTARLAERVHRAIRSLDGGEADLEQLGLELLAEVAGWDRADERAGPPAWLRQAREMLHEEPSEFRGLAALAERVGVHPVHLARSFRRAYGVTIGGYLRARRVRAARHLLAGSDRSIAEIAAVTGCSDQAHLTRLFRSATGWTPAAFRRQFGGAGD